MAQLINRKFKDVQHLIQEADVLLFRGTGLVSKFIKIVGRNRYSHVAIASWKWSKIDGVFVPNLLECIEFREWKGGRTTSLCRQVETHDGLIDVYRPSTKLQVFDNDNLHGKWVHLDSIKVTDTMRQLTGLPYGWKRIWLLAKTHMPGVRLISLPDINDTDICDTYPVCSTAVSRAFRVGYTDLIKNLSDDFVEPSHFAMCPALSYLFTLTV